MELTALGPGGFAADAPVFVDGALAGVQLRDVGIGRDGKEKDTFEAGGVDAIGAFLSEVRGPLFLLGALWGPYMGDLSIPASF